MIINGIEIDRDNLSDKGLTTLRSFKPRSLIMWGKNGAT